MPPSGRASVGWVIGATFVVLGLVLLAVVVVRGRADDGDATASPTTARSSATGDPVAAAIGTGTTAPLGSGGLGGGTVPERDGRSPLAGFGEAVLTVTAPDGTVCELCVLAAADDAQRERGLMEVTDRTLGGYDGMVFEYPEAIRGAFWMRNTPTPLSIAYFGADGSLVSTADMAPCGDRPDCVTYPADDAFRFALEVPRGELAAAGVVPGSRLQIVARRCPLAASR